ncbi:MAG: hypothetical protein RBS13_02945 [Bacteroidales bacterium]|nr:hypothetical protein [Bacteroidales bacterium]
MSEKIETNCYKVICYSANSRLYDQNFKTLKACIQFIHNALDNENIGSLLSKMVIYPTYTSLTDTLMFKRAYVRSTIPNVVYVIMKIQTGDIDADELYHLIREELDNEPS